MVYVVSVELDVVPISVVFETSVFGVPYLLVADVNVAVVVVLLCGCRVVQCTTKHLNYLKASYDPTQLRCCCCYCV